MILRITKKEIKELVRDRRFQLTAGTVAVLLIASVFVSKAHYEHVNRQHLTAKDDTRNQWVSQDKKNPHSAAHYGTYAFKPKYPLSLVDPGVDKYSGVSIYLEAHRRNESQYIAAQDQTSLARFGDLTPDFILLLIVPLMIILMGFNAFTREMESGTWRLLQSQGVSVWKLATGKWLGIFTPVMLIVLPVYVLAFAFLSGIKDYGEFSLAALTILFAVYILYYAVFTSITLIVSALSRNSGISFVALLGVWILACLAVPKVATNTAQDLYPYPTQLEFEKRIVAEKSGGMSVTEDWNKEMKRIEEETLKQYNVGSVSELPINLDGLLMMKGEEHDAEIYFKHYRLLKETQEDQSGVYRAFSTLSPFLPAKFLSMAICRTDYVSHWNFADAAERYRLSLVNQMNGDMMNNSKTGDWSYMADKDLWKSVPDFDYAPPSYGQVLSVNSGNIGTLVLWLVLSFGLFVGVTKRIKTQ